MKPSKYPNSVLMMINSCIVNSAFICLDYRFHYGEIKSTEILGMFKQIRYNFCFNFLWSRNSAINLAKSQGCLVHHNHLSSNVYCIYKC